MQALQHPAQQDLNERWQPTAAQRAVAAAMLAAEPQATHVIVGLALPGKTDGWWQVGQAVEAAPGFWLADRSTREGLLSYSAAREAADAAAGAQLAGRPGTSSYVSISRTGHCAAYEGIHGVDAPAAEVGTPATGVPQRAFDI